MVHLHEYVNILLFKSWGNINVPYYSCRQTDIRDIFLLINFVKDKKWVKNEISERCDLKDRLSKALSKINSKQFKDELQGVFGMVDDKVFERNKRLVSELKNDWCRNYKIVTNKIFK